ncbi:MAPEG family protein [Pseudomonas putida]|uniref:MAPEG family protein n=1 Tax=Pseudomonas putida TaxID=303 RepID=UPI000819171B|nr:MAPEG family protein [Pseudomonas putida]OCT32705.1 glutathione metabolism protein [Pseudomonas putida]OCT32761.1 glutathione metabolism protein [Pseudomonas putida]OCT34383.1 glutathione metabolism protein [Pseudomonas putida]OCT41227.1 glutathione metabolism protein [Pseudomonas putida]
MSSALSVYASCVVLLFLKMLAISCYQGYYRLRWHAFVNSEDAAVFQRSPQRAERPEVVRAMQAWRNDLENIPLFIALGGLALALGAPASTTAWLSGVFTGARVLHTLMYLTGLQPWRTLSYGVGVMCLMGLAGTVLLEVGARAIE